MLKYNFILENNLIDCATHNETKGDKSNKERITESGTTTEEHLAHDPTC